MTKLQKVSCVILSFCFFAVLAVMPGPFFLRGNVYRQFPLYCFLEQKARSVSLQEDPETYDMLAKSNKEYLARMMEAENLKNDIVQDPEEITDTGIQRQEAEASENEDRHFQKETPTQIPTQKPLATEAPSVTSRPDGTKKGSSPGQEKTAAPALAQIQPAPVIDLAPETLANYNYLLNNFFIVDSNTATSAEQLNAAEFLANDLTVEKNQKVPQILIYHSHSQETFKDSREGEVEDTIVGVGNYLTKLLTETYGYQVIHVTEAFDLAEGYLDRNKAYDYARPHIEKILKENPSIEVVIDLHRDGVSEDRHLVTEINGKPTAQIMFYNGLSYTLSNGQVDYLPNPYIQDNLAFSFQMEYQAAQYYPELYRGIYLSGLRYNLHLRKRAVLLEAGAQTNTVQEVKNAMEPFADILDRVLTGR